MFFVQADNSEKQRGVYKLAYKSCYKEIYVSIYIKILLLVLCTRCLFTDFDFHTY